MLRQLPRCCGMRQLSTDVSHPSFYDSTVEKYAQLAPSTITIDQMLHWGRLAVQDPAFILKSARHVQAELPKRLARRLLDLQLLPHLVVTNPHIKEVYDGYRQSFDELRSVPPVQSHEDNAAFNALLRKNLDAHATMLDRLATGLRECKGKQLVGPSLQLDSFFDNMLHSRISRRVIAEQHLHLGTRRQGYVGIVCTDLSVREALEFAAQKTRQICTESFGVAPDIFVSGGGGGACMQYIPTHLDYMLFELLKNAARASVETAQQLAHGRPQHAGAGGGRPRVPPISVRICDGGSDLTIRISDQGGGVPLRLQRHIWSYGFSTVGMDDKEMARWLQQPGSTGARVSPGAYTPWDSSNNGSSLGGTYSQDAPLQVTDEDPAAAAGFAQQQQQQQEQKEKGGAVGGLGQHGTVDLQAGFSESGSLGRRLQMAGLGFGLPLSRLYARYFGGDLTLQVIPGYGTDAYLTLKRRDEGQGSGGHTQDHVATEDGEGVE